MGDFARTAASFETGSPGCRGNRGGPEGAAIEERLTRLQAAGNLCGWAWRWIIDRRRPLRPRDRDWRRRVGHWRRARGIRRRFGRRARRRVRRWPLGMRLRDMGADI